MRRRNNAEDSTNDDKTVLTFVSPGTTKPKEESMYASYERKIKKKAARAALNIKGAVPTKGQLLQHTRQTLREISVRRVNYCLGCMSCFIVVMTVSLMVSVLANAPIAWLRLAELSSGEIDFRIWGAEFTGYTRLNYTAVREVLDVDEKHSYHSPRLIGNVNAIPKSWCKSDDGKELDPGDVKWKYFGIGREHDCAENGTDCKMCWENAEAPGECFSDACGTSAYTGSLYLLDPEREKRMDIGREWTLGNINNASCFMHKSLANSMHVHKGDTIYLRIQLDRYFTGLYHNIMRPLLEEYNRTDANNGTDSNKTRDNLPKDYRYYFYDVYMPVTVQDIYSDPKGKHQIKVTNSIMMDINQFLPYFVHHLHPKLPAEIKQHWSEVKIVEYAGQVLINMPPPRTEFYLKTDNGVIRKDVIAFGSDMYFKLGFNQLLTEVPVLDSLDDTRFFSLFLGLILNVVIVILLGLSVLLIYSLLMVNVETRTFELGVMRLIGTTRAGVVQLLLFQAFSYAAPSWIFGLIAAQVTMYFGAIIFQDMSGVPISPWLTPMSMVAGSFLGILIPIVSAILPIRHALGQNLHDSLDTRHAKVQAVSVSLERSEDASFSWSVVIIGAVMALFGFGIYYVMPLSLLTLNFTLLLNLFFLLLMGMLLGLVLLSLNVEHLLEVILVEVFLFWEKYAVRQCVLKNLVAHRKRNRKTTIMYALALGFIIFIMVSYTSVLDSVSYQKKSSGGTLLKVRNSAWAGDEYHRFEASIQNVSGLEEAASKHPHVKGFSWISREWEGAVPGFQKSHIWNPGMVFDDHSHIYSISPNYYDTVLPGFFQMSEGSYTANGMSLSENLYTVDGSSRAWMGTFMKRLLGLEDLDTKVVLELYVVPKDQADKARTTRVIDSGSSGGGGAGGFGGGGGSIGGGGQGGSPFGVRVQVADTGSYIQRSFIRPLALFNSAPVFKFSKFPTSTRQDNIFSHTSLLRYGFGYWNSIEDLPLGHFLVSLKDDLDDDQIDSVVEMLETCIRGQYGSEVWDFRDSVGPITKASSILSLFFLFTTAISMLIASFSLVSSMYTNIYEQTKEIGILRAVGLGVWSLRRIYVYEAFVLVFASSMLGVLIGSIVGYTLLLQRILFTQLPIPFTFPWQVMLVVFASSMFFAFVSSIGPINRVMQKPIVTLLRE